MAKIVDDAIGRLPESIQRELNDAWASGKSSPYTRAVDPLNATLLHRAQTIRGMQMEIAALKAQRHELLAGLEAAFPRGFSTINANVPDEIIVPVDFTMAELRAMAALIAKHKGAEHG